MDTNPAEELLDELFDSLERLETQTTAILQFLKSKSKLTEKQLAPYLEEAERSSNVKWRAARLRVGSLMSSAIRSAEESLDRKFEQKPEKQEAAPRKAVDKDKAEAQHDEPAAPKTDPSLQDASKDKAPQESAAQSNGHETERPESVNKPSEKSEARDGQLRA